MMRRTWCFILHLWQEWELLGKYSHCLFSGKGEERLKLWISLRITCMIHDTKIVTSRLHCNVAFDLFRP